MINRNFRMMVRQSVMIVIALCAMMISSYAQSVTYHCDCNEILDDEYIEFEITVVGTGPFELCNANGLFISVNPIIPVPNNYVLTEVAAGEYMLSGFAYNNVLPTVEVKAANGSVISVNMLTCMKPSADITTTNPGVRFCVGEEIALTAGVMVGNIIPASVNNSTVVWQAPGAIINPPATNTGNLNTIVSYPNPGNYIVQVSGKTYSGCPFTDDFVIDIIDPRDGLEISGSCYMCTAQATLGMSYSIDNPNGYGLNWCTTPNTATYSPMAGGDPLTGSGSTVTATFPAAGTYTLLVKNANPNKCAIDIEKEVVVVDVIDTLAINGSKYACEGETIQYSLNAGSFVSGSVSWSVSPNTGVTMTPAGGASDIIDLQFMTMNTIYTLTATGLSADGCDFESEIEIHVPSDQDGSIACNNLVNVSLNNDCVLELVPDMILEGSNNNDAFTIEIFDATTGEVITNNMITQDQLGHTFMVTVHQRCGENSCWGNLVVEDKSITPLECKDETFYTTCYNIDDKINPVGFPDFDADVVATYRQATDDWLLVGFDNCSDAILSYTDENTSLNVCEDPQEITRTWLVTDINNGATSTCASEIHVNLVDENSIQWPPNYDTGLDAEGGDAMLTDTDNTFASLDPCNNFPHPNLFCGTSWTADASGNPAPSCTGSPTGLLCTNLQLIGYKDQEIPICGNSKKILRQWTVWDACANDEIMHTQIITIMDTQPPLCIAPPETQAYTDLHECGATVYIDGPTVSNECEDWTYTIRYKLRDENGIIPSTFSDDGVKYDAAQNLYYIENLPFDSDTLWVNYIVRDICGNETDECVNEIELIDNEQPIPACDLNTVVTLNDEGCAYAGPQSFDDHSWDNCGIYQTVARRMDNRCDCNYGRFDFMYPLGEYNGHAYFLSKTKMHAQKAFDLSRALDAYTAVVNSAQENSWIREKVDAFTDECYIIGLQGVSNGSAVSGLSWMEGTSAYSNWAASEPVIDKAIFARGNVHTYVNQDGTWDAERRNYKEAYYVVEVEADCQWTQQVKFCCADVGKETMVVMRVIDNFGNHNECMVRVEVKDHIGPVITCPSDVTIDCDQDASTATAQATATDLCGIERIVSIESDDNYECGDDFVLITRTWTATDIGGNKAACVQTIRKENRNPFRGSSIRWPQEHTFTNQPCSLKDLDPSDLPNNKQEPSWPDHKCSNLAASYEDLLFIDVDGFCQKLVRTWTVVDWCNPDNFWTHNQVIKMSNDIAPQISSASCSTMVITDGEVVGPCQVSVDAIEAELSPVNNNCAESPTWTYQIFFEGNNSTNPDRAGSGFIAANTYPYGQHRIIWTVTDDCDNTSTCTKILDVKDSKAPTPYCHSEIVIPLSQDSCVTIWASDLDLGSSDDCPDNDVRLSFEENTLVTNKTFCCEDLDPGSNWGLLDVQLWVWDPDNNKEYCTVSLTLQDNRNLCDNIGTGGKATIAGMIATEELEMVPSVEMTVTEGQNPLNDMSMTGEYAFDELDMFKNYTVDPFKDDQYMNGVSTLDLVIIQKHILGVEYLDSPYKVIAADVDNSQFITAIDLIELRKLILGIYDELPANDSWRFVDRDHQFTSTFNPFPYPEVINVNNLTSDIMDADFIAVKIGDVNSTVTTNLDDTEIDSRESRSFDIDVNKIVTEKGNTRIQFLATTDADLAGFQADFDVEFSEDQLMAFIPLALDIEQENIAWNKLADEKLVISWNGGAKLSEGDVLFEVLVRGDHKGQLKVADQLLKTEAYLDSGNGIDVTAISLKGTSVKSDFVFAVSQNVPNPFKDAAVVEFSLPERSEVVLTITDQNGRLVYKEQNEYEAGQNKLVLKAEQINASGVLYYQLSTDKNTATKKMIIIK